MSDQNQLLLDRAAALVEAAARAGADASDAVSVLSRSRSVSVRNGVVENTDASEGDSLSLRVFVDGCVASVAADVSTPVDMLAQRAVSMARVSPQDKYNILPDASMLAKEFADLDKNDPTEILTEKLVENALAVEAAALDVAGVTGSMGGSASAGSSGMVLASSNGFSGYYEGTGFGFSVSVIAGEGTKMERDYDFSSASHFADLKGPEEVGKSAGERAVKRLNPRKVDTQSVMAVYDPRVARGVLGHLTGAINGGAVARKSTFLRDAMGQKIANSSVTVVDDPFIKRNSGSRPFDGEGIAGERMTMVEEGVLQNWYLSTPIANELGLTTNGRGRRSGTQVGAGPTNVFIEPGDKTPEELIAEMGTGLYVTEMIGSGVNMVTGEYSRGVSGYWVENGELTFPVSEVTLASNLKDMFLRMVPANDLDRKYAIAAPTLIFENMMLAGT
ncbi:MAG: TldD/PmbA family protein [Pseudomonadota bacterium]